MGGCGPPRRAVSGGSLALDGLLGPPPVDDERPAPDRAGRLADFLDSGCADCFGRFWFDAPLMAEPAPNTPDWAPADQPAAVADPDADPHRPQVYRLETASSGQVTVRRVPPVPPPDPRAAPVAPRLHPTVPAGSPLTPVLRVFADLCLTVRERSWSTQGKAAAARARVQARHPSGDHTAPIWAVALVAADPRAFDQEIADLAGELKESGASALLAEVAGDWARRHGEPLARPPRLAAPLVLDLNGPAPVPPAPADEQPPDLTRLAVGVERALLAGRSRAAQRWGLLWAGWPLRALGWLLLLPLGALLPLLLLVAAGADGGGSAGAGPDLAAGGAPRSARWLEQAPAQGWVLLEGAARAASAGWQSFDLWHRIGWVALWPLLLFVWFRWPDAWLPAGLRLRLGRLDRPLPAWLHWLDNLFAGSFLGVLFRSLPAAGRGSADRDGEALRRWLHWRLFGGDRELVLLVVRAPTALTAAETAWLRGLLAGRGPGQGLLCVTWLADLAQVPGGWLPLVLPAAADPDPDADADGRWDERLVIHDPAAPRLDGALIRAPGPAPGLAGLLGCDDAPGGARPCGSLVGSLADDRWTAFDLLPTLVLGSTPAMPLVLVRKAVLAWEQAAADWQREAYPFRALCDGPGCTAGAAADDLTLLFELAGRAAALTTDIRGARPPRWACCGGRGEQRLPLARALAAALVDPDLARGYLAHAVAGGEVWHLLRCVEALTGRPLGEPLWGGLAGLAPVPEAPDLRGQGRPPASGAELPLHLEAALLLSGERLGLTAAGSDPALRATLARAWLALAAALHAPLPSDRPWPDREARARGVEASRLWCAWLAALERLEQAGNPPAGRPRLADLVAGLGDPSPASLGDGPSAAADPGSIAGLFAAEVAGMLDALALLDPANARALLDQRLRQDWALLPETAKARLRAVCEGSGGRVLAALLAALDGAADDAAAAAAVLAVAGRFARRPALVVAALAALAGPLVPGADAPQARLLDIARFIVTLQRALAPAADGAQRESLPALLPPPGWDRAALARAGARAAALVADAGFSARLAPLLVAGEARRRALAAELAEGASDLPGLALGVHLPALLTMDRLRDELRATAGS